MLDFDVSPTKEVIELPTLLKSVLLYNCIFVGFVKVAVYPTNKNCQGPKLAKKTTDTDDKVVLCRAVTVFVVGRAYRLIVVVNVMYMFVSLRLSKTDLGRSELVLSCVVLSVGEVTTVFENIEIYGACVFEFNIIITLDLLLE